MSSLILPLLIVCLLAAPVVAGFLYRRIGSRNDRRKYAAPDGWVNIDQNRALYLHRLGNDGPVVVFESGIAATHLNWRRIQTEVAAFASTISYDRAGLGWSSPATSDRTPANLADELEAMLDAAGIEPPYILVGHSFGGLVVRRFALSRPHRVAGMVLVDPMRINQWPPLDPSKQATLEFGMKMARIACPIARIGFARLVLRSLLDGSGRLARLMKNLTGPRGRMVLDRISTEVAKMPREVWPVVAAHWSRPDFFAEVLRCLQGVPAAVLEIHGSSPVSGVPTVVLTPASDECLSPAELAAIGDNVEQVIAGTSAHWIHLDEPNLVIDAIRSLALAAIPVRTTTRER